MDPRGYIATFARRIFVAIALVGVSLTACAAPEASCEKSGVTLQVLGSGGPIADDGRASSAYLVWVDGKSKFLIDAGGGAFLRFAEAGGDFNELDFIGISHFHTDHSADLPALLKSGYFAKRTRDLGISGPAGSEPFPGLHDYLDSMIGKPNGAYRYLAGYLDGSGGLPALELKEVALDETGPVSVFGEAGDELRIEAMSVPHAIVPALAYRLFVGDTSIVFASDQNGSKEQFKAFAKDADAMVMHMPVPEGITGAGRKLHAPPSVIGEIAADANVGHLVLSHFMARSLQSLDKNVAIVESAYPGTVSVAADLSCINLKNQAMH